MAWACDHGLRKRLQCSGVAALNDGADHTPSADPFGPANEHVGFVRGELLGQGSRLLPQVAGLALQPRDGIGNSTGWIES